MKNKKNLIIKALFGVFLIILLAIEVAHAIWRFDDDVYLMLSRFAGGGACIVSKAVAADGTTFCISSTSQMSTVKNGTYYSVDQGVEPDISLTKMESFYDRQALTALINVTK